MHAPASSGVDKNGNNVYVYDDKITFTFNYKDGTRTVMLSELSDGKNNSDLKCQGAPKGETKTVSSFFVHLRELELRSPADAASPLRQPTAATSPASTGEHTPKMHQKK